MAKSVTGIRLAIAALLFAPLLVHAAGLGRLHVNSALGQPLRAEIEIVSLQPGEVDSLQARLATPEAFRQAGIELSGALLGLQFAIDKRGERAVLRLSTVQPVNEPFLDVLIELSWATGRLVREYTFLLDPAEMKAEPRVAAAPAPAPAMKPAPEAAALAPRAAARPAPAAPAAAAAAGQHEVRKGDTLAAIARQNLPAGVTLNQMLIALYRANQAAFIRGNINLVRAGRILNIPDREAVAAIGAAEAGKLVLVQAQMADFAEADPGKPGAPAAKAAREDDRVARERALKEAQSRVGDLEKNVADLQKLVEMKSQQMAELEKKAAAKPAAPAPAPVPAAPAAKAPEPVKQAPKDTPKDAPKDSAKEPAKKAKPAAAPVKAAPEKSFLEEFIEDPIALAVLGGVVLLLGGYRAWAWRRKKASQTTMFQDSVLGAATGAGAASVFSGAEAQPAAAAPPPATAPADASEASVSGVSVGGGESDKVDPIAEADVYMACGRDAQAEEILKAAIGKDPNRFEVYAKLLEIYASRKDAKSFEQTALKLKGLTGSAGPAWDKAISLGHSIDPDNGLYGSGGAAAEAAVAAAPSATAPALDFDIGGGAEAAAAPKADSGGLNFDIGSATTAIPKSDFAVGGTLKLDSDETKAASAGLDFDLGGADDGEKTMLLAPKKPAAKVDPAATVAMDFDLNIDLGASNAEPAKPAADAPLDLGGLSFDLGTPGEVGAGGADPKWQEVATKLDRAKAYQEMGNKNGARELLNEAVREGDAAQKSQAQQMLSGLG